VHHHESSHHLTRRTLTKAVVGASIVGLHTTSGRWVATADASASRSRSDALARLPPLDGTLLLDEATLTDYAQDFGQIVSERPAAVLRPGSIRDVSRMLRFANRHDIRVVNRGRAHSTFGQSQHPASIVFDLTTLDTIDMIDGDIVTVGAGCRWSALLEHTLVGGKMPPVLPDYIGQTVGGTLSVGGIGAMSFRDGVGPGVQPPAVRPRPRAGRHPVPDQRRRARRLGLGGPLRRCSRPNVDSTAATRWPAGPTCWVDSGSRQALLRPDATIASRPVSDQQ